MKTTDDKLRKILYKAIKKSDEASYAIEDEIDAIFKALNKKGYEITRMGAFSTILLEEKLAIDKLSKDLDISPKGVLKQALRLYQLTNSRLNAGETMSFSGDEQRAREFSGKYT